MYKINNGTYKVDYFNYPERYIQYIILDNLPNKKNKYGPQNDRI